MSPRSIRRAAERKQQKLQRKQERLTITPPAVAAPDDSDSAADEAAVLSEPKTQTNADFSPELIAEARAARDRIEARLAARAETNRANALHSTGPVTPEGKLASSRNSLKHGLTSGALIIPGEDPAEFETLLQALIEDHQPAGPTEHLLVHQLAQSHWLEQRAIRLQSDCFTANGIDEKRLALFLRYQTTHQRAFYRALHQLSRLQKERRRSAGGFVSHKPSTTLPELGFVSQNSSAAHPEPPSEAGNLAQGPVMALNQIDPKAHQLYGR